ncbi:MAG TPA: glycosyltransferase family 25 protein, partial [Devosiaceae bacterium]|nr:glycosyltransferase family 25 protein [Devosiaceae bacterium]
AADLTAADKERFANPRRRFWLTEVELACSHSHLRVLKAIIDSGAPYGLLFEDDVVLSARLPQFLAAFDVAPPPIDIIRLEADLAPLRVSAASPLEIDGVALRQVWSWSSGAAGYIISRRAAQRAVETGSMLAKQTDRVLFNPYEPSLLGEFSMRHADPALCIQSDRLQRIETVAASDLSAGRSRRDAIEGKLRLYRALYTLGEIYERDIRMGVLKAWHQYVGGARKRTIPFEAD